MPTNAEELKAQAEWREITTQQHAALYAVLPQDPNTSDLRPYIHEMITAVIQRQVAYRLRTSVSPDQALEHLTHDVARWFAVPESSQHLSAEQILPTFLELAHQAYLAKEEYASSLFADRGEHKGSEIMRLIEHQFIKVILDRLWARYLQQLHAIFTSLGIQKVARGDLRKAAKLPFADLQQTIPTFRSLSLDKF